MEIRKMRAKSLYSPPHQSLDDLFNEWIEQNPQADIINIYHSSCVSEEEIFEQLFITYFDLMEEQSGNE